MSSNKKIVGAVALITVAVLTSCSTKDNNGIHNPTLTAVEETTKYDEKKPLSEKEAVKQAKKMLSEEEKNTITNYDSPKVEQVSFKKEPDFYKYQDVGELKGKEAYKVTYETTMDGLLGPITMYIGVKDGKCYGMDLRE